MYPAAMRVKDCIALHSHKLRLISITESLESLNPFFHVQSNFLTNVTKHVSIPSKVLGAGSRRCACSGHKEVDCSLKLFCATDYQQLLCKWSLN